MVEMQSVRNARGLELFYDPDDERGRSLARSSGAVNPVANALWALAVGLHDWDTILDVGSNYGEMLACADLSHAGRVIAFEPNPDVAECLRATTARLPWPVEVRQTAIGSEARATVTFEHDDTWSGKSRVLDGSTTLAGSTSKDRVHTETVESTSIDAVFDGVLPASICCKIDVEGLEAAVLDGAQHTFATVPRVAVMLEILHMPVQDLERLARRYPLFLVRADGSELVRWTGTDPVRLGALLHDGSLHRENAVLIAGSDAAAFADEIGSGARRSVRRAVYTALMGAYEPLRDQPLASGSDVDFICFTDDPALTSDTWRVHLVEPRFPEDRVRSARHIKVVGHPDLAPYGETIWIDNRVELRADPDEIMDELLADADVAVFEHSFHPTLVDEFLAVADGGYDDTPRVYEQLIAYSEHETSVLDERPLWTGFMARRRTEDVTTAMSIWMDQILRHSRRDQLSLPVALRRSRARVDRIADNNRTSRWHSWPPLDATERARRTAAVSASTAMRPPFVRMRDDDGSDATARIAELESTIRTRDDEIRAVSRSLEKQKDARRSLERRLAATEEFRDRLEVALAEQKQARKTLEGRLTDAADRVAELKGRISDAQYRLRGARRELESIQGDRGFRAVQRLRRLVGRG